MPYAEARDMKDDAGQPLVQHPVACIDCHDPKTMELRVTRPGFLAASRRCKARQGIAGLRPEPRRLAAGDALLRLRPVPRRVLLQGRGASSSPTRGPTASRSSRSRPTTTRRASPTGRTPRPARKMLKAQHPEFEVWNQGIHARAGVACADCHMPYKRDGAIKVSDHWVRSPLLNINRACQTCHAVPGGGARGAGRSRSRTGTTALLAARREGDDGHAGRDRGREEGRRPATPSSRRRARCIARRSGGSTSSPPRTRWGSTPRRSWPASWREAIDYARQGQLEAARVARSR